MPRSPTRVSKPSGKPSTSSSSRATPRGARDRSRRPRPARRRRCSRPRWRRTGTAPAAPRAMLRAQPREVVARARPRRRAAPCPAADRTAAAAARARVLLPEPVRPDQRDRRAGGHAERDVAQRRLAGAGIGERERRGTRARRAPRPGAAAAGGLGDRRRARRGSPSMRRERGQAALEDVDHPAERHHRPVEHAEVDRERHELAERDVARDHLAAADPEREQRAEPREERERGREEARGADELQVARAVVLVQLRERRRSRAARRANARTTRMPPRFSCTCAESRAKRSWTRSKRRWMRSPKNHTDSETSGSGSSAYSVSRGLIAEHEADRDHADRERVDRVHDARPQHDAHRGHVVGRDAT